jgi:hypothetical protein
MINTLAELGMPSLICTYLTPGMIKGYTPGSAGFPARQDTRVQEILMMQDCPPYLK